MATVALLLLMTVVSLSGCAGVVPDVATLREQGYQAVRLRWTTAAGEERDSGIELWWKESKDPERKAYFCLVPPPGYSGYGYQWAMVVFIDAKETWTYESGSFTDHSKAREGISCTVSAPLPEGRLTFRVTKFQFWH